MASRCRTCRLSIPNAVLVNMPAPDKLAALAPHFGTLVDAAHEFEADALEGATPATPLEFLRWLEVDVRRAAGLSLKRRPGLHGDE